MTVMKCQLWPTAVLVMAQAVVQLVTQTLLSMVELVIVTLCLQWLSVQPVMVRGHVQLVTLTLL